MTNKKSGGPRRKTRRKFKRSKERLTITKLLQEFSPGARVHIKIDSSVHSGLPDKRFQGLTGTVKEKRGKKGIVVSVFQGNSLKTIVTHAAHLTAVKEKALVIAK